jgi:hypothetical protein
LWSCVHPAPLNPEQQRNFNLSYADIENPRALTEAAVEIAPARGGIAYDTNTLGNWQRSRDGQVAGGLRLMKEGKRGGQQHYYIAQG